MADLSAEEGPVARQTHQLDQYAIRGIDKAEKLQARFDKKGRQNKQIGEKEKEPAGGFDDTPVPQAEPGFTVKFTFHKATQLPIADINTLSSDPYVDAELITDLKARHKQDPPMRHRTRTIRRNVDPEWNEHWIVANVPRSGFRLKCRLYDEDPADHDDRLGNVHILVSCLDSNFPGIHEQAYKIKKSSGSKRAYLFRGCAAMLNSHVHLSGELVISIEVLGQTEGGWGGRMWTVGPCTWTRHFSPMIGRLAGTKDTEQTDEKGQRVERYNFQANQIQLSGPVPGEMYHRYVEFRPFIKGMFTGLGLRGRILNRALHHQHAHIYNYDRATQYGSFDEPSIDLTRKFLDLVHYDQGGKIFTYVLSLDGLWRFTETGKEFGIDLLSKHTMHSDVSIYIAYSGEFFIRRLKSAHHSSEGTDQAAGEAIQSGTGETTMDPSFYQLIIDNDSGTYRPNKDLLPLLKQFISASLPGLKITPLDCVADKDKMDKLKNEQRERRKADGQNRVFAQVSDASSISSSDESDLDDAVLRVNDQPRPHRRDKLKKRWEQRRQQTAEIPHPSAEIPETDNSTPAKTSGLDNVS